MKSTLLLFTLGVALVGCGDSSSAGGAALDDTASSDMVSGEVSRSTDIGWVDASDGVPPDDMGSDATNDDTGSLNDSLESDTPETDSEAPDTGEPDTAEPDTDEPDTTGPDTTGPDTTGPGDDLTESTPCQSDLDCNSGNACVGWQCNDFDYTCDNVWGPADCCTDDSDCDDSTACTKDVCYKALGACIHNDDACP